jgi:hypothetical protein
MQDYLVSSIKRVYDDCYRALDEGNSQNVGRAIINRYNELLGEIQEEYPDNERIQNLDPVSETGAGIAGGSTRPHPNDLQEVKFGVTTIADSVGLNLNDFERVNEGSEIPVIHIHNQQSQSQAQDQSQEQYITIEEIHEEIDRLMTSSEERELIEERVEEFESELENENPNKDRMLDIISFVRDTSTQLASKLGMVALQRGVDLLDAIG